MITMTKVNPFITTHRTLHLKQRQLYVHPNEFLNRRNNWATKRTMSALFVEHSEYLVLKVSCRRASAKIVPRQDCAKDSQEIS